MPLTSPSSQSNYSLDGQCLHNSSVHKDLGIFMKSDLSWSDHYSFIISKAYRELSILRRSFHSLHSPSAKRTLYVTFVRSHLIYCSPVWRPRFIKDVQLLERVQRRATKYILDDFTSDYKDRLISLDLLLLMMFYKLLDIMFFVKSFKSPNDCFNISSYLKFATCATRSSNLKLIHTRSPNNTSRHFYFNRFPRLWNALPPINLNLPINIIKSQVKLFLWNYFLQNFDSNNFCTYHLLCPCNSCMLTPCITAWFWLPTCCWYAFSTLFIMYLAIP